MGDGTTGSSPARFFSMPTAGFLLVCFLLALTVRLLYLFAFRDSVFFSHLVVDAAWHDEWARDLAAGTWDPDGRAFFRAPLYPLWLSLLYRWFDADLMGVRMVQMLIGAGTASALAGAADGLAGRRGGWITGLAASLYGPLVFFDGELLIPGLLVSLVSWSLFLAVRGTGVPSILGAAFLLGLAGIARPNALVLIPVLGFWVSGRGRRSLAVWAGVLGLGLLPAIGVTGVNRGLEGAWVPVASQGGVNFYAGNHARATGRTVEIPEMGRLLTWREFVDRSREVAESETGTELDSGAVSRWWFRKGLAWIRDHPGDAAALYARKLYYLVNASEIPSNRDLYTDRPGFLKALLWRVPGFAFPWGLVFPLAVMGLVLAMIERRRLLWQSMGLWILFYSISILPFFVNARFRMGLVPALLVLAGFALSRGRKAIRLPVLGAGLLSLVLTNTHLAQVRQENPGLELSRRGEALLALERNEEGVAVLEEAYALEPSATTAYLLADAYSRTGRYEEAEGHMLRVIQERPADADLHFTLGALRLQQEDFENAVKTFQTVVDLRPGDGAAWVNLGAAHEGLGRISEAVQSYERGIEFLPREELGYIRLSDLLISRGDFDRAGVVLAAALAYQPRSVDLIYNRARVEVGLGRLDRAREEVRKALQIQPRDSRVLELEKWLRDRKP